MPIHGDKSKRRDKAATSEYFKRASVLARHVNDGEKGCGLLPRLPKQNRHHAIGAGMGKRLARTAIDIHASDATRRV